MTIHKPTRRIGAIKKLKGNSFPKEFLIFDTETFIENITPDRIKFPLRLGVVIYVKIDTNHNIIKRNVFRFYSPQEFVNIIKQYANRRKTLYVFAHNIKFDIMVTNLPFVLFDNGITHRYPIINERMFIWRANYGTSTIVFIDTANYGVISVELLGEDLGYEKLSVDFNKVSDDELLTYCIRDCEILEKFILSYLEFIHRNKLGSFRPTLASQSLAAWRTSFMRKSVHIHNDKSALSLERASYHGGRTECFALGDMPEQPYYYLDVNSMYPYIMKTCVTPIALLYTVNDLTVEKLYKYVLAHYCIADVLIDTDLPVYPLVAKDKLLFPVGQFRTTLHHKELSYAFAHGHVKQAYGVALYEFANIFGYYVDFFYSLKQQSKKDNNATWYILSKLFQNSLYGKMAQSGVISETIKGPYERIIKRSEGHELHTFNYSTEINWFGTIVREKKEGESSYSFPACAGAITANARMWLWQLIECADHNNVLYCDTDSLITNQAGYNNLQGFLDPYTLGMLKLEKMSHYLTISGAKDYEFGDIIRHKGISPKAEQQSRTKWRTIQFDGILPWFSAGGNVDATAEYIVKRRVSDYNKGKYDDRTRRVIPYYCSIGADNSLILS